MKVSLIIILLLVSVSGLFGQDGSDIMYCKASAIDNTLVGRYVHFDFYRRSFRGRQIDTVVINVDKRPIQFVEVRKDNGYNNWFYEQYLQSIGMVDGAIVRISKCKLENVTKQSVTATLYLDYYDLSNKIVADKSRQLMYLFDREIIIEVLVQSE